MDINLEIIVIVSVSVCSFMQMCVNYLVISTSYCKIIIFNLSLQTVHTIINSEYSRLTKFGPGKCLGQHNNP